MALTAQPPAPANWARWPQHHPNNDYHVILDAGMMPYEPRPLASPPLQRSSMAPSYFTTAPLSAAPITSIVVPQYQTPTPYSGYTPFPPSPPLGSSFKQEPHSQQQCTERTQLRVMSVEPEAEPVRNIQYIKESRSPVEGSQSPSIKSETQMSYRSTSSEGRRSARTITSNFTVSGAGHVDFNTGVDTLMKAIQAKADAEALLKTESGSGSPGTECKVEPNPQASTPIDQQGDAKQKDRKVFFCDIEGCSKSFFQKTHLDIHRRAHTGDKPYTCKLPGCGARFSQLGNLKTHERRHTGDKPYSCPQCGKRFAQRGNVRAHLKTHNQTKPFLCKLDNCNKTFTQLGNLKSHQNKFHVDTLNSLTAKFAAISDWSTISKDDKELWEYFATLYKNSNKGIKGRGKHRKVGCVSQMSPEPSSHSLPSHYSISVAHGLPMLHTPHPTHHRLPYQGLSHPAAYSMSRPAVLVPLHRDSHSGYDMFDAEDASVSSGHTSATGSHMYDEDHGRELAFGDRMY